MTIHLPEDLESSIRLEVTRGHFATIDDAVAAAWQAYIDQRNRQEIGPRTPDNGQGGHSTSETRKTADGALSTQPTEAPERRPIWDVIDSLRKNVPPEEFSKLPKDGAEQLDHYLYGSPKRSTS